MKCLTCKHSMTTKGYDPISQCVRSTIQCLKSGDKYLSHVGPNMKGLNDFMFYNVAGKEVGYPVIDCDGWEGK